MQSSGSEAGLRIGAYILCAIAALVFALAVSAGRGGFGFVLALVSLPFLVAAGHLYRRSKQVVAPSVAEALAQDKRGPVLYLRAFKDDEKMRQGDHSGSSLFEDVSSTFIRQEERLAEVLSRIGPVIALGAPGEALPGLGAAREYPRSDEWQQRIREHMRAASLVVIHIGQTENLLWEFREALVMVAPQRLVLFAPKYRDYEAFCQSAGDVIQLPAYPREALRPLSASERIAAGLIAKPDQKIEYMPRWADVSWAVTGIVYFGQNWEAHFVALGLREGERRNIGSALTHAMRPVFDQLGVVWEPPPLQFGYVLSRALSRMVAIVGIGILCVAVVMILVSLLTFSR